VSRSQAGESITIGRLSAADGALLEAFLAADGGEAAREELRAARARHDLLADEGAWVLLARVGEAPAGAALAVRVPKWDSRAGFLFLDELLVLRPFRRRGVARALLGRVEALARELGLAGVRLLVRPENAGARRLYAAAGFRQSQAMFCEKSSR
jgi:ribosomal protein S18 acetylase RimI-like enzyme